jgi:hypothetical protein
MSVTSSRKINLGDLCDGIRNLTPARGSGFCEAAAVSFDRQGHTSGVSLYVTGAFAEEVEIEYPTVTDQMRKSWKDDREAADDGASGVAILMMRELTRLTVVERSVTGTGFDYWLGPEDKDDDELIFQDKVRLEISGINKGSTADVRRRVEGKLTQTKQSDSMKLSAYVVVVEFGKPCSQVVKK